MERAKPIHDGFKLLDVQHNEAGEAGAISNAILALGAYEATKVDRELPDQRRCENCRKWLECGEVDSRCDQHEYEPGSDYGTD